MQCLLENWFQFGVCFSTWIWPCSDGLCAQCTNGDHFLFNSISVQMGFFLPISWVPIFVFFVFFWVRFLFSLLRVVNWLFLTFHFSFSQSTRFPSMFLPSFVCLLFLSVLFSSYGSWWKLVRFCYGRKCHRRRWRPGWIREFDCSLTGTAILGRDATDSWPLLALDAALIAHQGVHASFCPFWSLSFVSTRYRCKWNDQMGLHHETYRIFCSTSQLIIVTLPTPTVKLIKLCTAWQGWDPNKRRNWL